jgi:hypothetical protein
MISGLIMFLAVAVALAYSGVLVAAVQWFTSAREGQDVAIALKCAISALQ